MIDVFKIPKIFFLKIFIQKQSGDSYDSDAVSCYFRAYVYAIFTIINEMIYLVNYKKTKFFDFVFAELEALMGHPRLFSYKNFQTKKFRDF